MQARSKLVLLELISGSIGWIWIIASIAAAYFFVAALFFEGKWPSFFWAIGIGIVAKGLFRGMKDNQPRVEYEAKPVSEGVAPVEAQQAWVGAYSESGAERTATDGDSAIGPDALAFRKAQELVGNYGAVLESSLNITQSEAMLPATKDEIKGALVLLAQHAKAENVPAEKVESLRTAYAHLADFVSPQKADSAVGFENLITPGASELSDAELLALANKMAASSDDALGVARSSTDDFARLIKEFDERLND